VVKVIETFYKDALRSTLPTLILGHPLTESPHHHQTPNSERTKLQNTWRICTEQMNSSSFSSSELIISSKVSRGEQNPIEIQIVPAIVPVGAIVSVSYVSLKHMLEKFPLPVLDCGAAHGCSCLYHS
jgi:hypothetical protein